MNLKEKPLIVMVGSFTTYQLNPRDEWEKEKPIIIGKNCWIGTNVVILPGVELGDNVIVGAGAVVTKSFLSNCVLAGVPAKLI